MNRMNYIKVMLLAFLTFQFFSCENEPLTGEFPQEDQNDAEEGQFKAKIDDADFIASVATATLTSDNELVITGSKPGGENITLGIKDAAVGTFSLTSNGVNENTGNYFDGSTNIIPYISVQAIGGSGQLKISALDPVAKTVSGTFSFIGVRIQLDPDGNPVLDGNGDPVLEDVEISRGSFTEIEYILDDTGGGGGGGNDPKNEFFAKIDGVDFLANTIEVTEPMVGDVHMIKVEAKTAEGQLIRIDVPRSLGVGSFDMVRISDGTELIGIYNAGDGAENLTSDPGTIDITEFDLEEGVLKATFIFTATDPLNQLPDIVEVTEGTMTVYFEGVPGANNAFSANIDGTSYTPDDIVVETSVVNQYPTLTITTTLGDERMILTFPLTVTEGNTYEMSTEVIVGDEVVATYTPVVGTSITYISDPGSMVITRYDLTEGIIEGTFNFSSKDASGQDPTIYQITAGEFLVVLP